MIVMDDWSAYISTEVPYESSAMTQSDPISTTYVGDTPHHEETDTDFAEECEHGEVNRLFGQRARQYVQDIVCWAQATCEYVLGGHHELAQGSRI